MKLTTPTGAIKAEMTSTLTTTKLTALHKKLALTAAAMALTGTLYLSKPAAAGPGDESIPVDIMSIYGVGPDAAADIRALDWWETRDRGSVSDEQFLALISLYNGHAGHERDVLTVECLSFAVQWMADGPSSAVQLASVAMIVRDVLGDDAADADVVFAAAHAARMLGLEQDPEIFARLIIHQQRLAADAELTAWITEVLAGVDSPYRRGIAD